MDDERVLPKAVEKPAAKAKSKVSARTITLVAALFLGFIMIYFDKNAIGIILVSMQQDFGFSNVQKGMVMSAFFIGYAAMQVPAGILNTKLGSKPILTFAMAAIAVFATLAGFAKAVMFIIVIRFLAGAIAHSGYAPSAAKEVATKLPLDQRTLAQGILISASGIAGIIVPLVVSPVLADYGWQRAFWMIAGASIIVGIILRFVLPSDKKTKNLTAENADDAVAAEEVPAAKLREVISEPFVWLLGVLNFTINAMMYGMLNWMPSYLIQSVGLSTIVQGHITAIGGAAFLVGAIGGSYIVGKFFFGKEKTVIGIAGMLGALSLFTASMSTDTGLITVALSLGEFFCATTFVTLMSLPVKRFAAHKFGPSYAIVATGGILGGIVSPTLIGLLVDMASGAYFMVFIYFVILGALLFVLSRFIPKHKPVENEVN